MTVVCKVKGCPYNSKYQFCRNKLISMTPNGQCGHIYRDNGSVRQNWQIPVKEEFMEGNNEQEKN